MKQLFRKKFSWIFTLAVAALMVMPFAAFADNVNNDVIVGGSDTITAGGSTIVGYKIVATSGADGQSGCNAADSTPATLTITKPAAVSASATSLTFTSCGNFQYVTFGSNTGGNYAINVGVGDSGVGGYNNNANFTLHVNDPPVTNTAPSITVPSDITTEATGPSGAVVTYIATASDAQDGSLTPTCDPDSGSMFALGVTTVTCDVTDSGGLSAPTKTFKVTVQDTTEPELSLPSNISVYATGSSAATVNYSASASDLVDGTVTVTCTPASGSSFPVGTTIVNCSATDEHNNTANDSFTVSVSYNWVGFFSPVDNGGTLNRVKAGSAIPVKFSLSGNQGLSIFAAGSPSSALITCSPSATVDDIETTVTAGGSSLSYDASSDQYNYVWKTDKAWAGTCRQLKVTLKDGTPHTANFQFIK